MTCVVAESSLEQVLDNWINQFALGRLGNREFVATALAFLPCSTYPRVPGGAKSQA